MPRERGHVTQAGMQAMVIVVRHQFADDRLGGKIVSAVVVIRLIAHRAIEALHNAV